MGETNGVLDEISQISDNDPKVLNAKGIVISTFNSNAEVKELEDYFTSLNRNFFLFEVGAENTAYNIVNKKIHDGLFSNIEPEANNLLEKTNRFMDELHKDLSSPLSEHIKRMILNNSRDIVNKDLSGVTVGMEEINVEGKLSEEEKRSKILSIIEKGYSNLTDLEKQILKYLSKKK
jgi:hypothetical protein